MKTLGSYIHHDMVPELRPEDVKSIRYSVDNGKIIDHHKEIYLYMSKNKQIDFSTRDYYYKYVVKKEEPVLLGIFFGFTRNHLYDYKNTLKIVPNTSFHKRLHKGKTLYEHRTHLLVKL